MLVVSRARPPAAATIRCPGRKRDLHESPLEPRAVRRLFAER